MQACDCSISNEIKLTSISSCVCLSILNTSVATYSSDSSLPSSAVGERVGLWIARDGELPRVISAVMEGVFGCSTGGLVEGGGSWNDLNKVNSIHKFLKLSKHLNYDF